MVGSRQPEPVAAIEVQRSDNTVRAARGLAVSVAACLLLVPSGLLLIGVAIVSSGPNSDTGERASTGSIVALWAVGAALLLSCVPVVYLAARNRALIATLLTAAGLGAAILTIYAS